MKIKFKILRYVGHLKPGWTFDPRPHWPFRPTPNGCWPPETGGHLRLLQHNFVVDSYQGKLVGKYCSSRRPAVTSTGRSLYLRFVSDLTDTDRGFKLQYSSVEGTTPGKYNLAIFR